VNFPLGAINQTPRTGEAPGVRQPSGAFAPELEACAIRNPKSEIRNPKSEIRSKLKTQNSKLSLSSRLFLFLPLSSFPVNFQLGSYRTTIAIILAVAAVLIITVIGREIYRAVHPPNKPMRKRKRREF
jgi:hypothetical protein